MLKKGEIPPNRNECQRKCVSLTRCMGRERTSGSQAQNKDESYEKNEMFVEKSKGEERNREK